MNIRKGLSQLLITCICFMLVCCRQKTAEITAFTNVNLIPMTSEIVLENKNVLVSDSEIIAIGDVDLLENPGIVKVIDGKGAFLLPGLADMHMHTRADWEDPEVWPVHPLDLYLANGVTTIRDFTPYGSPLDHALQWRDEIREGIRSGPSIYASGKLLYASPLGNPEGIVQKNYDMGFDFLKVYSYLSMDDFQRVVTAAKDLGMYTAGHIPYAVGLDKVLEAEMDEIAHVEELMYEFIEFDREVELAPEEWVAHIIGSAVQQLDFSSKTLLDDFESGNIEILNRITSQLNGAQVPVCTTMVLDDIIQQKLFQPQAFLERPENVYFEAGYLDSYLRKEEKHQVQCRGNEEICMFKLEVDRWILQGLHQDGVLLLLGTDSGTGGMGIIPGYSIHDELRILVENGFTPYEALLTGTVNAAAVVERMTGQGDFGTIEVGKRADLILLEGNPLWDLSTVRHPIGVMAAGKWYSAESLAQMIKIPETKTSIN